MPATGVLDRIKGHRRTVEVLKRDLDSGRPHHAYLLIGPPGIGKGEVARALSRALTCPAEPWKGCGKCSSCLHADRGDHPDIKEVVPIKGTFRIDQVRDIRASMADSPFVSPRKVYLFFAVETMTREAANALLKVLEEPPPHVYFILTAGAIGAVPETVLSRCRIEFLAPLSREETVERLQETAGLDPERAEMWGSVLDGGPDRFIEWKQVWGDDFPREVVDFLGDPGKCTPDDLFNLSRELERQAGKEDPRTELVRFLEMLAGFLAACRLSEIGRVPSHPAFTGILEGGLGPYLEDAYQQVVTARNLLEANVNVRMTLDRLFLGLQILLADR